MSAAPVGLSLPPKINTKISFFCVREAMDIECLQRGDGIWPLIGIANWNYRRLYLTKLFDEKIFSVTWRWVPISFWWFHLFRKEMKNHLVLYQEAKSRWVLEKVLFDLRTQSFCFCLWQLQSETCDFLVGWVHSLELDATVQRIQN